MGTNDHTPTSTPVLIRIKAVPGASRDSIAGILGDRLKVRTSAPPEGGKANKAICKLIAKALAIKPAMVKMHAGHTNPEKVVQILGCPIETIGAKLGIDARLIRSGTRRAPKGS